MFIFVIFMFLTLSINLSRIKCIFEDMFLLIIVATAKEIYIKQLVSIFPKSFKTQHQKYCTQLYK
jgi:hypothetical protein